MYLLYMSLSQRGKGSQGGDEPSPWVVFSGCLTLFFLSMKKSSDSLSFPTLCTKSVWLSTLMPHSASNLEPCHFPTRRGGDFLPGQCCPSNLQASLSGSSSLFSRRGIWLFVLWWTLGASSEILGWWRSEESTLNYTITSSLYTYFKVTLAAEALSL